MQAPALPILISIDPGVYSCAVAAWGTPQRPVQGARGVLYHAALTAPCGASETALRTLELIHSWGWEGARVVVEVPVKYATRRSTHRDVERLLEVVEEIRGSYSPERYLGCTPFAWKGNIPKGIHGKRILNSLSDRERGRITWPKKVLQHNVIDAVGIGLWHLGRARAGRGASPEA